MNDTPGLTRALWHRPFSRVAAAGVALGCLVAGLVLGEVLGWPFLAGPLQRVLSERLDRRVVLAADADPGGTPPSGFRIRFAGGVRLHSAQLEIGAPAWSTAPHLMRARDVSLDLRYSDLWRAWRGDALRVERLQAAELDAVLERLADGRASWQLRPLLAADGSAPPPPTFGRLEVTAGTLHYRDAPLALDAQLRLSLTDTGTSDDEPAPAASGASAVPGASASVLRLTASGRFRDRPLKVELKSSGVMPWAGDDTQAVPVPLTLRATVGQATLDLEGSAVDALHLGGLSGRFKLTGPSLAAVGDPLGVTLPTTAAFRAAGVVVQQGAKWAVRVDDADVGASRLKGAFIYQGAAAGRLPLLSGRLGGARLSVADLGPALGTTLAVAAAPASAGASAPVVLAARTRGKGKVLPDRPFDLAALRAMDANVLIDIREVDLNTPRLEPLRPLRGHLRLAGGVLIFSDLDARMGQGQLKGTVALDGRGDQALWTAALRWDGVRIESWLHPRPVAGLTQFITGRLSGQVALAGHGRSTAEILASLSGHARGELRDGTVSHLAIEAAGLDLAESLGVFVKGDDMLAVQCAVSDLRVEAGVFRPRVMVLDTTDSTVWVEGSLSLATEAIDLRLVVSPKDFSPLALRTPLRWAGTLTDPKLSVEQGPIGLKLAAAVVLAFVNPLAALIPLLDVGDSDEARRGAAGCQALMQRSRARLAAPAAAR